MATGEAIDLFAANLIEKCPGHKCCSCGRFVKSDQVGHHGPDFEGDFWIEGFCKNCDRGVGVECLVPKK